MGSKFLLPFGIDLHYYGAHLAFSAPPAILASYRDKVREFEILIEQQYKDFQTSFVETVEKDAEAGLVENVQVSLCGTRVLGQQTTPTTTVDSNNNPRSKIATGGETIGMVKPTTSNISSAMPSKVSTASIHASDSASSPGKFVARHSRSATDEGTSIVGSSTKSIPSLLRRDTYRAEQREKYKVLLEKAQAQYIIMRSYVPLSKEQFYSKFEQKVINEKASTIKPNGKLHNCSPHQRMKLLNLKKTIVYEFLKHHKIKYDKSVAFSRDESSSQHRGGTASAPVNGADGGTSTRA